DESRAREALDALLADDRAERTRLAEAERAATAAREQLRPADDRARASDVAAMEARLNLESLREQVLVELAALGEVGLRHLAEAAGDDGRDRDDADDPGDAIDGQIDEASGEGAALEAALAALVPGWASGPPD